MNARNKGQNMHCELPMTVDAGLEWPNTHVLVVFTFQHLNDRATIINAKACKEMSREEFPRCCYSYLYQEATKRTFKVRSDVGVASS